MRGRRLLQQRSPPSAGKPTQATCEDGGVLDGLRGALRHRGHIHLRAGRWAVSCIAVNSDTNGPSDELVFAIARELLTNAVRHSSATHIALSLRRDGNSLVLAVDDDGRGLDRDRPEQARRDGQLGLAACSGRVATHGGQMTITSSESYGTNVAIALPITTATSPDNTPIFTNPNTLP